MSTIPRRDRSGNRYWQMKQHYSSTIAELREIARKAGYATPTNIRKANIVNIIHRIHRQLPNYSPCTLTELRKFAFDRKLITTAKTGTHKQLLRLLTAADDDVQFSLLFDLPPELRCAIYRWYMAPFPEELESPAQPPLTRVSRAVRREATPIFYQSCHFLLDLTRTKGVKHHFRFEDDTHHFLSSLMAPHIAAIRRFQFQFYLARNVSGIDVYKIDVELRTGEKGFLPRVKAHKFLMSQSGTTEVDASCEKMEKALVEYFATRRATEAEGKEVKLRAEHFYGARRKMDEIMHPD
ncbi:hypothetical protein M409DRAFT_59057 [Zasmidium cellare ATCC 36951]|uniref:Uncharacterized protein n=1 Tax=Zasmidium cellare ATCC 36951 TaxID=1080233 RepID=A0A6A6C5Z4_ZASCE|nr:uncharacterized protein M409DRAFT_59057 [Zasmidium cellare ATCC 36951]KAF2161678.1 hypothetical protein M409DRAFT_59057 [Zasmidium cellare ATCC 36951]